MARKTIMYFVLFIIGINGNIFAEECNGKKIETDNCVQLSIKDMETLLSSGKLKIITVMINSHNTISLINKTGVIIMTKESEYVVVAGDQKRIDTIKAYGFHTRESVEKDHKLRNVKIWVNSKKQIDEIRKSISDVFPVDESSGYIHGRAYDYQLKFLQDNGYRVELIK
jgi:hypothetical protein